MRKTLLLITTLFLSTASSAQDPFDSKPNLLWWSDDLNLSAPLEENHYDSFVSEADIWKKDWGFSGKLLQNDGDLFGLPNDSEFTNFDVKRRFTSSDDSFFALGLGWQDIDIKSQLEASGPKLSLEGRYNLSAVELYGQTAWFPELENTFQEDALTGYEFEAGVMLRPLPSLSLKAGYRHFELKYDSDTSIDDALGSSSGFLLGTDLSW